MKLKHNQGITISCIHAQRQNSHQNHHGSPTWPQHTPQLSLDPGQSAIRPARHQPTLSLVFFPNQPAGQSAASPVPKTFSLASTSRLEPLLFPLAHRNHPPLCLVCSSSLIPLFLPLPNRQNVYPRLLRHCQAGQRRMRFFPASFFSSARLLFAPRLGA